MNTSGLRSKASGMEFFSLADAFDKEVRLITRRHLRTFQKRGEYLQGEIEKIAQSALEEYHLHKEDYKERPLDQVVNILAVVVAHHQLEPTLEAINKDMNQFANENEQIKSMMDRCPLFREGVERRPSIIEDNPRGLTKRIAENFKPAIRTLIEPVLVRDQSKGILIDSMYWLMNYIKG